MIDKQELLFVVDENNRPLKPKPRSFVHKNKLWHRTAHIYVVNRKGQLLCQKRSKKKDTNPDKWEPFFGGHLNSREEYPAVAVKEINEEIGLDIEESALIPYKIHRNAHHPEFRMIYKVYWDGDIGSLRLEEDEVDRVEWFDIREVGKILLSKNPNWTLKENDEEVISWIKKPSSTIPS